MDDRMLGSCSIECLTARLAVLSEARLKLDVGLSPSLGAASSRFSCLPPA